MSVPSRQRRVQKAWLDGGAIVGVGKGVRGAKGVDGLVMGSEFPSGLGESRDRASQRDPGQCPGRKRISLLSKLYRISDADSLFFCGTPTPTLGLAV